MYLVEVEYFGGELAGEREIIPYYHDTYEDGAKEVDRLNNLNNGKAYRLYKTTGELVYDPVEEEE